MYIWKYTHLRFHPVKNLTTENLYQSIISSHDTGVDGPKRYASGGCHVIISLPSIIVAMIQHITINTRQ